MVLIRICKYVSGKQMWYLYQNKKKIKKNESGSFIAISQGSCFKVMVKFKQTVCVDLMLHKPEISLNASRRRTILTTQLVNNTHAANSCLAFNLSHLILLLLPVSPLLRSKGFFLPVCKSWNGSSQIFQQISVLVKPKTASVTSVTVQDQH